MTLRNNVALGIVGLLAGGALTFVAAPLASAAPAKGCDSPALSTPARAGDVAKNNPSAFKQAEKRNAGKVPGFAKKAQSDRSLWLDKCADAFYVDETVSAGERADAAATMGAQATGAALPFASVPLDQTFTLNSKPGSNRTIYLDFKGGSVSGTAWNNTYGTPVTYEPYSIDATVDTNFSDAELIEIQKTWQTVSEDYAPFDVNVTTQDPGAAAIDRTSSSDLVYGTRAAITNGGVIYTKCGCGGVAYVGVFNTSGSNHNYYQPAWVFSNGTTKNGKYIGEATSHEVGHNFGLNHDDVNGSGYYSGSAPWAPIMGASYSQPVSQWSTGLYPGGTNHQDDVAQIATGAPYVTDEDTAGPLALGNGDQINGIISKETDVDSYTFVAAGTTSITVDNGGPFPDLDVKLTVLNANGQFVVSSSPTTSRISATVVNGMNAAATFDAPVAGATYTVQIQGVGQGDPTLAGGYSAYGSLGTYRVGLTTQPGGEPTPLALSVGSLPNGTVGSAYSASALTASGGVAPYTYSVTGLPSGLTLNTSNGGITGTPTASGGFTPSFTVTDSLGATATQGGSLTVAAAPAVVVANQSASGTVGTALSKQLVATGGNGSYSWSRTAGTLPPGMTFSSGGLLSGTPTAAGTYTFSATATSAGQTGTGTVTVTIAAAPSPLAWVTAAGLPAGKRNVAYSTTLSVSGGTPGYTWTRTAGKLPNGLVLTGNGANATISGTPSKNGSYSFTLRVTDSKGASVTRSFTISIAR